MKLIKPNRKYYSSYLEAINDKTSQNKYDFFYNGEGDLYKKVMEYHKGINLPPGYVSGDVLWLVDRNEFIGEINIRHKLTPFLENYGGHIGYAISGSKRNQGYGTIMLREALKFIKENLKLNKVLLTCDEDNYASTRVIEKNGGEFIDLVINLIDNKEIKTKRYYIKLID